MALAALLGCPSTILAHDGRPLEPHDLWSAWDWTPAVVIPLILAALLYGSGVRRVWRLSFGRGVRRWEALCFAAGWLTLAASLVSPIHALGSVLFSAHMTQHELMMVVAAPLIVAGRPLVAYVWGLPRSSRRYVQALTHDDRIRRWWAWLTAPIVTSVIHAAAVGLWHLPGPYQLTLDSEIAHALQHLSFLATALLFWWAMLRPRRQSRGQAIACLFATTLWTGALGALLAFAPRLWYPRYAATTSLWGVTPLEDQQLGGIIMWIPGGVSYLVAVLWLLALWLRESERRAQRPRVLAISEQPT
jgi:putative membrane protein